MGPNRQGFLHQFATLETFLCRETRVHSYYPVSSVLSFGRENIEKRAPRSIHDGLREMMIFDHPINVQVFNGYRLIAFGIRLCHFEMEVSTLPFDFQVRQGNRTTGLASSFASLLAAGLHAFFAPENLLRSAIETRVLNSIAFAIGEKALEANVNTDGRMLTCRQGYAPVASRRI